MTARRRCARVSDGLGAHMDKYELQDVFAEGDGLVANTSFTGLSLAYDEASGASFDTVAFRSCVFDNVDFSRCAFRDARFEGCRFIRCSMERAWLDHCDFLSCSAPGLNLLQARLATVLIEDTDLSYANLSEVSASHLVVRSSRLNEAALQRAKLKDVSLRACDLVRVDVFGTPLVGIDVSTCRFEAPVLSDGHRELRGAVVSAQQALDLSSLLGLVIADDGD